MGMFSGLNIAATSMSAQRLRMDVISNNIANANTERTTEGGPFQRSNVVMRPLIDQPYWKSPFLPSALDNGPGKGVRVDRIQKDSTPGNLRWDPSHPDSILEGPNKGFVLGSNVNIVNEMVDLISASRAYEASATLIEGEKSAFGQALNIAR
ncbi:flagellar basal body rod protein FlgC [Entomospira culicis]|uniref:Flagellar basal-body rod protein FlgC n=1 Tax=Entomospira culicis TaxID=2719989 RepID=A0A968GIS1_9SPIO|nr:flagellar basal body rod protein FlgC [Entomospira culicis]NIZ19376.1 flagellar basal body rod protein FlgC [Entomospira culicis]NIZ69719.1 flagellar basal body rod protein FlgC [Entomospira culicis]WDI36830.1 flagellar basal body rod protein FlgC [Entomospira culicis]WDI38459.1 flagellar basal body rod protein FlgC [Entomospira culicis]